MCCIGLRTLSLIVGWIHIIYATTAIVLAICLDYYARKVIFKSPKFADLRQVEPIIFVLYLMLNVCRLVIAGYLIKGIMQRRRSLMAPFVYGQCVILVMFVSLVIMDAVYDLKNGKDNPYSLLDLLADSTYAALTTLFLWPVYSLYRKMDYQPQQHNASNYVTDTTTSYVHSCDV